MAGPPEKFDRFEVVLPESNILRFRFLVESYDGVANTRTIDKQAGRVEVLCPPEERDLIQALLLDLKELLAISHWDG